MGAVGAAVGFGDLPEPRSTRCSAPSSSRSPAMPAPTQIHLAMERGEVMGRGGNSWSSVQTANTSWIKENKINMLVQVGFEKEPDLPQVPLLLDLVKAMKSKGVIRVVSLPTAHRLRPLGRARRAEGPRRGAAHGLCGGDEGSGVPQGDREDRHGDPRRRPAPRSRRWSAGDQRRRRRCSIARRRF